MTYTAKMVKDAKLKKWYWRAHDEKGENQFSSFAKYATQQSATAHWSNVKRKLAEVRLTEFVEKQKATETENSKLKALMKKLEEKNAGAQETITNLMKKVASLQKGCDQFNSLAEGLEESVKEACAENDRLDAKLKQVQAEHKEIIATNQKLANLNIDWETKYGDLEKELGERHEEEAAKNDRLTETINALYADLDKKRKENVENYNRWQAAEDKVIEMEKEVKRANAGARACFIFTVLVVVGVIAFELF